MDAEVVADDDVTRVQGRGEHLLDPGRERVSIHSALDKHWCVDPVTAQPGDEGVVAPVSVRDSAQARDPARRAPGHLGIEPAFVNEYEP